MTVLSISFVEEYIFVCHGGVFVIRWELLEGGIDANASFKCQEITCHFDTFCQARGEYSQTVILASQQYFRDN